MNNPFASAFQLRPLSISPIFNGFSRLNIRYLFIDMLFYQKIFKADNH